MTTSTPSRFAADVRAISVLAVPLVGNNLSVIGMQFADTVMAGQLGPRDLARARGRRRFLSPVPADRLGMMMACRRTCAHAYGANDKHGVTRYCRQAWWVALALAAAAGHGSLQVDRVLPALGIAPEILPTAIGYVHAMTWGMPALMGFFALRYTSEGLGRTRPIMYFAFSA
jgi:MATE family multidrug resistance protein